ncbi:MAG: hypothetical protein RLZZ262_725 [Bacteroidota bacterium]|jgi:hypothetical protein
MKKCYVLLFVAVHTSLAAAANSASPEPQQKQPEKKTENQTPKALSKGYFSIFDLLLSTPEPQDTTKKVVAPTKAS